MPTAGAKRALTAWSCSTVKPWRPPRASISAATARRAACASPIPGRWRTSPRRRAGSGALLLARLLPEELQPRLLGEHLGGVLRGRLVERAGVHLQGGLGVVEAALVLAQDLRPDLDIHFRLEERLFAAVVGELFGMELRHDLHQ